MYKKKNTYESWVAKGTGYNVIKFFFLRFKCLLLGSALWYWCWSSESPRSVLLTLCWPLSAGSVRRAKGKERRRDLFLLGCFLFVSVSITLAMLTPKDQFLSVGDESSFLFSPHHAPLQDLSTHVPFLKIWLEYHAIILPSPKSGISATLANNSSSEARVSALWGLLSKLLALIIQISFCYSPVLGVVSVSLQEW